MGPVINPAENNKAAFRLYVTAVAVLSVLYAVMFCLYPVHNDDLWYTAHSHGDVHSFEYFVSTMQNCLDHWTFDTSRLCNLVVGIFLGLMPKWLYAVLTGLVLLWIFTVGPALARSRYISVAAAGWICTITFVFPWIDYMFGTVYSTNYIWTIGLGLTLLWLYFIRPASSTVLIGTLAYVVGWWHEGFAVPLTAMMATYLAVRWRTPSRKALVMVIALVLGILTLVLIPGFRSQVIERQSTLVKGVLWETLIHAVAFNCLFYLYIAMLIVFALYRRTRTWLMANNRARLAFCLGIMAFGLVGTTVYFMYYNGPRTGAFNQIICAIGIMYLCGAFVRRRATSMVAVGVVLLAAYVNILAAIRVQTHLTREFETVTAGIDPEADPLDKVVFFDRTPVRLGPDFLKPSYMALNHSKTPYDISILPAVMAGFDPTEASATSIPGIFIFRNNLVFEGILTEDDVAKIQIVSKDGSTEVSRVTCMPFRSADGSVWTFLQLKSRIAKPDTSPIDDVHTAD